MGSTFGAVHVKGAALSATVERVRDWLEEDGFTLLGDDAEESDFERRILVFEASGWVTVADEELTTNEEEGDRLASLLSRETDAIAITVFHSDTALFSRYRLGERVGGFQVPEEGKVDRKTGHRRVAAKFLSDLAGDAEAKKELESGLRADFTFPEETAVIAAKLIGLPHPGAGARYLWREPPPNAIKLRFAMPEEEDVTPGEMEWSPPVMEGHAQYLSSPADHATVVGMPLYEQVTLTLDAHSGERCKGIGVELGGSGAALLDIPEMAGWNPDLSTPGGTEIMIVPVVDGRARFPRASVAPSTLAMPSGTSAAALRAWQAAMRDQAKNKFVFHLRGRAKTPGRGALVVRVTDLEGKPLDANEARIELVVAPAPRQPLVPARAEPPTEPHAARRYGMALQEYGGADRVVGWIGFDAKFATTARAWLLDAANTLATFLARAVGKLEITVTSAGTHPTMKGFQDGKDLAKDERLLRCLEDEADVKIHVPYAAMMGPNGMRNMSTVQLRHQPHGTTIFGTEQREQLKAMRPMPRIVPLDLSFSLSRAACVPALGEELDRVFRAAAAMPECIGGFVAPMGAVDAGEQHPYETLLGLHRAHEEMEVIRARPPSPGWRSIVPRAMVDALDVQPGVTRTDTPAGALLATGGSDPLAMTVDDREAIERTLLRAWNTVS